MPESEVDRSLRELESTLRRLDSLRADGLLTDAEYETARQRALDAADLGVEERNEEPPSEEAPAAATSPGEDAQEALVREGGAPSVRFRLRLPEQQQKGLWGRLSSPREQLRNIPTWVKVILVFFTVVVVLIIIGSTVGDSEEVDDEESVRPAATTAPRTVPTPRPTAPPTRTSPTEPPGLGTFEVGNLKLTVLAVDTYDAPGEDSNYRVKLRLRKLGGSTYDFTDSVFQIIDQNGHAHDHDTSCNGCPGNLIPNGKGFVIRDDTLVERWVYFEITREITPSEFRFESSSVSAPSNSTKIPSSPRPVVRESREQPKLFSVVQVGSLQLTVLEVDTYDATGEDSNYRVRIRIRKTKGDTYEFTNSVFQIIDSSGYTHNHDTSCRDCPGNIIPDGYGFILRGSQPVEKWVYFEITREITPSEFRFEASSISAPSVLIKIPPEPRPVVRATRETPEPTKVPAPTTRPSPRSTQEPEECPSTLEGLWASEVAAAMESTLDPADELSDLFGLAGENSSLLISAEWRALVAVNLALLDLAADEMLAVTAPSNRTRSIQNTVDTIAREIKAGVSNITIGLDSFDAATLERGSSSINRAGQLMTQVTTQVDRLCQ